MSPVRDRKEERAHLSVGVIDALYSTKLIKLNIAPKKNDNKQNFTYYNFDSNSTILFKVFNIMCFIYSQKFVILPHFPTLQRIIIFLLLRELPIESFHFIRHTAIFPS